MLHPHKMVNHQDISGAVWKKPVLLVKCGWISSLITFNNQKLLLAALGWTTTFCVPGWLTIRFTWCLGIQFFRLIWKPLKICSKLLDFLDEIQQPPVNIQKAMEIRGVPIHNYNLQMLDDVHFFLNVCMYIHPRTHMGICIYIYLYIYVYIYISIYIYTSYIYIYIRQRYFSRSLAALALWSIGTPFFRRPTKKVRNPMELGMFFFPTRKCGVVFRNQK